MGCNNHAHNYLQLKTTNNSTLSLFVNKAELDAMFTEWIEKLQCAYNSLKVANCVSQIFLTINHYNYVATCT